MVTACLQLNMKTVQRVCVCAIYIVQIVHACILAVMLCCE